MNSFSEIIREKTTDEFCSGEEKRKYKRQREFNNPNFPICSRIRMYGKQYIYRPIQ